MVLLPGGEIVPALKSGVLDASEWVGPWLDVFSGLNTAVGDHDYPGFHPGTGLFLGVNRRVWEGLDANDRRLIETVAAGEFARSLAEFNANNAIWLRKLRDEGKVKILRFDDTLLRAFREISADVVAEFADGDEVTRGSTPAIRGSARCPPTGATSPNGASTNARRTCMRRRRDGGAKFAAPRFRSVGGDRQDQASSPARECNEAALSNAASLG